MSKFKDLIIKALKEDEAFNDISTRLVFGPNVKLQAQLVAKQEGIICGLEIFKDVFCSFKKRCHIEILSKDGDKVRPGQILAIIKGPARVILSAERTALNFIQHLSGIATLTSFFVEKVKGTNAKIYDTRKTLPGLRELEKYAVRCGGGFNHRMSLKDMVMLKDNHLRKIKNLQKEVSKIRRLKPNKKIEIECQSFDDVKNAIDARADIIMLDNMDMKTLVKSIRFIREQASNLPLSNKVKEYKPLIEISGGVTLENVKKLAELDVDMISVGSITHSAPALDISLEINDIS